MEEKNHLAFQLNVFEGPLDLLLSLIEKNKMDIYDISIHEITQQYLEHVSQMQVFSMEVASDFLWMASTLLHIKSRMLLPRKKNEEEEDPREELVLQLLAYKRCKIFVDFLKKRWKNYAFYATKEESLPVCLGLGERKQIFPPLSYEKFCLACQRVCDRNALRFNDLSKKMTSILRREPLPLHRCITKMWHQIQAKQKLYFTELLSEQADSREEVSSFLALLELLRLHEVEVEQTHSFAPLLIEPKKDTMSPELEELIQHLMREEEENHAFS